MSDVEAWIEEQTGARIRGTRRIQSLWSGYGEIVRVQLRDHPPVVLKRVNAPKAGGRSHRRKLRSYAVEQAFYRRFAERCDDACRVPQALAMKELSCERWFLLEDLDAAGFGGRRHGLGADEVDACLRWLARFHATFLGVEPKELWPVGTYWHLATRPDELDTMPAGHLKDRAAQWDARLNSATHQTFVHGDAKPANFCFGPDGVAAVDFQYVGGGAGVKDVAYLLGCLGGRELERSADRWLDRYFSALRAEGVDAAVEDEWRALFPVAWADFERFLAGWSPGHGSRGGFTRRMIADAG